MRKKRIKNIKLKRLIQKRLRKVLKKRRRVDDDESHVKSKKQQYSKRSKKLSKQLHKNQSVSVCPPTNFSIVNNSLETLTFYQNMMNTFEEIHPVYLDVSNTEKITIDALLYLLAVVNQMKFRNIPVHLRGNLPKKMDVRKKFVESGFLDYCKSKSETIFASGDCVRIIDGKKS